MIQKLKSMIVAVVALSFVAVPVVAVPTTALAATSIQNNLCSGTNLDITGGNTTCNAKGSASNFNTLLKNIVNIFSAIVGVIAVIMIIVGGLRYITSGGDSGNVSTAKNTIIYAIVGLVIVALAQLIVHFVLGQANSLSGS